MFNHNEYLYLLTEKVVKKIEKISLKFIPYINYNNIDIDVDLFEDNLILIIIKKKGFHSYFKIKHIIKSDNDKFNSLIDIFQLCFNTPNLYFIEYERLEKFNKYITLKEINEFTNKYKINKISISNKINNYNLIEINSSTIIKIINNEIINNNKKEDEIVSIKDEIVSIDDEIITMEIPILWIPCKKLIKLIKKEIITKYLIIDHYKKCLKCEINNNNNKDFEFNKKLIFKNSDDEYEIEKIIDNYHFIKKYDIPYSNLIYYEYDKKKINLIYNNIENNIYYKCIFIIYE